MFESLTRFTSTLLGRSAYAAPLVNTGSIDLDDPSVMRSRAAMGGQLQLPTTPETRWYLSRLEQAEYDADGGNLKLAGKLMRSARMDGVFSGVLSTRTGGLVRLPKRFRGDADVVADLEVGHEQVDGEVRSVFDETFPPTELALLAADGILLGIGVGELVRVEGRAHPVFVRLQPEFLIYRWIENAWFFESAHGLVRIVPGDGRWILHVPGGRYMPWANGIWRAIGRAYIRKEHANLHKDNWEGKLANPARAAVMPQGGSEAQAESWFRTVMAWNINSVFGMKPGYDVKLIESNGRGWESFNKTIADQNTEMIIATTGQSVTTEGATGGFISGDMFKAIRADLIKDTADGLAYTINTQGIPAYVGAVWGEEAINEKQCIVEWDVTPPRDRAADAAALTATATAINQLTSALAPYDKQPDVDALCLRFAVPLETEAPTEDEAAADARPDVEQTLNGAQIASLLEVIGQVAAGQLPRDTAVEIIVAAFNMDREKADRLLGSVGKGFVPASTSVTVEPVEPVAEPELEEPMAVAA